MKSKGIVTWPEGERPRERLLRLGAQSVTDAELVAILLRVGVAGTNAVELARQIIKKFGSLRALAEAPLSALLEVKGLKGAKAAQLVAAMEVARRVSMPDGRKRIILKSTREVADYLRSRLQGLPDEHFRALFLNRRGKVGKGDIVVFTWGARFVQPLSSPAPVDYAVAVWKGCCMI